VPLIREADEDQTEPLMEHEVRILTRIARGFPSNQSIYRAAHNEEVYKSKKNGELIPHSDAERIKAV
jgi:hypothetical protein